MKKIILAIGVITLGLGFLLSGCGGTFGKALTKVLAEAGPYAIYFPATLQNHVSAGGEHPAIVGKELTVEAWIKTTTATDGAIFARGKNATGTNPQGVILYVDTNGDAAFESNNAVVTSAGGLNNLPPVNDGTWYHVAGVLAAIPHAHPNVGTCVGGGGGIHIDIYVNGNWENCNSIPSYPDVTMADTSNFIGRDTADVSLMNGAANPMPFMGTIDEVRFWTEARDREVIIGNPGLNFIKNWHDTEIRGEQWDRADPNVAIAGYWRMNEGTGTTATDASGYGNNGLALVVTDSFITTDLVEILDTWYPDWVPGYQPLAQ